MKQRIRQIADWLQYLLIRLAYLLYGIIPAYKAYSLASGVARTLYPLFRKRRAIAIDNIIQAGITTDKHEADHIARQAFGHFAGQICEALKAGQVITADNWRDHITYEGPATSSDLLFNQLDTPIMILTGHHGSWEAGATVISFFRPMIAVARKMNNPYVERFLRQNHFRGAITIIPKSRGFTSSVIRLWQEQQAAMTILMDQHAGKRHGMTIPFLGRPAGTHTSPARLHLKTGAPILVGSIIRERPFHYRMVTEIDPIIFTPTGDRKADTEKLLTEINSHLGKLIRRYPTQYLWAHKRWR